MNVIQNGQKFSFEDITATHTKLPVGNYMLKYNPRDGYHLIAKEDFTLPKKVYGNHSIVDRWIKSWNHNSDKNMGIVLSGIKGSGKTITAQKFCIEVGLPVIMITDGYSGPDFVDFMSNPLISECVVFIDEFEKIYQRDANQNELLSLMDGLHPTNLIFLLTINEDKLSSYLVNRLNRIKYRKNYEDLDLDTMNEVIDDMLINKEHRQSIFEFFDKVNLRTFDLLVNLIKEMNLFNEDATSCGAHLNLKAENKYYEVIEIYDGKEYPCNSVTTNPTSDTIVVNRKITSYLKKNEEIDDDDDYLDSIWEIYLKLDECKIDRKGSIFVVFDPVKNLRFRFTETKLRYIF